MHRFATTALGFIALATVAVGCGDDNSTADTVAVTAATTEVEETVVEETLVDETLIDDTTATGAAGEGTEFCELNDELDTVGETAMSSSSTPEELQEFFEVEFPAIIARLSAAAPPEIADDLAVSVEGFDLLAERLAANGWDLTATFNDPATAELMNVQKYSDASDAIIEFCG